MVANVKYLMKYKDTCRWVAFRNYRNTLQWLANCYKIYKYKTIKKFSDYKVKAMEKWRAQTVGNDLQRKYLTKAIFDSFLEIAIKSYCIAISNAHAYLKGCRVWFFFHYFISKISLPGWNSAWKAECHRKKKKCLTMREE